MCARVMCVRVQDVELIQFMGKDNVPFHTVIFPASLIGTGEPWTMMRSISVTEYLNYEGGKFSKSRGTGERARRTALLCCSQQVDGTQPGGVPVPPHRIMSAPAVGP